MNPRAQNIALIDTFQGWGSGSSSRLAIVPEEPAVRVLAIDFTQEGNDKGKWLTLTLDLSLCFPSQHKIESKCGDLTINRFCKLSGADFVP